MQFPVKNAVISLGKGDEDNHRLLPQKSTLEPIKEKKTIGDRQISETALNGNLAAYLEEVTQNNKTILVTRQDAKNAVILSDCFSF